LRGKRGDRPTSPRSWSPFGQQQFLGKRSIDLRELVSVLRPEMAKLLGNRIAWTSPRLVTRMGEADVALLEQVFAEPDDQRARRDAEGGSLTVDIFGIDAVNAHSPVGRRRNGERVCSASVSVTPAAA